MSKNVIKRGNLCTNENCLFQSWESHTHRNYEYNEKRVYSNILEAVGNTPLVKLNKIPEEAGLECDLYVKVEFLNPGGSSKDRMSIRMIEDAEDKGLLKPGATIVEPTAGNTGIGLAMAAAVKGYKCIIVMPEKMSGEKEATLKVLGAQIVRTPDLPHDDPNSFMGVAKRLSEEIPGSVLLGQFSNISNPLTHYDNTTEELLKQCDGKLDMLVLGAGTGGSMTGMSYKLKELYPSCQIVGVDPVGSDLALPQSLNETEVTSYEMEGIGAKHVWPTLHRDLVNHWIKITDKMSYNAVRRLIREEGILAGGSSGCSLAGALIAARNLKKGQKCVVILADGIRNYMTKFVTDNWMEINGFQEIVNEHNHWWWNRTLTELDLPKIKTIKSNLTYKEALKFFKTNGLQYALVENKDGTFKGSLCLAHLTRKVISQKYSLNNSIENVIDMKVQRASRNTILGLVSKILEVAEFAAVVDKSNRPISIVTHMQLMDYIANKGSNGSSVTKFGCCFKQRL